MARGRELCARLGETPFTIEVLGALGWLEFSRGRLREAQAAAQEILDFAERVRTDAIVASAHNALGSACLWMGRFEEARKHLTETISIHDRNIPHYLPILDAPVIPSRCQMAWTLWLMGYTDQALAQVEHALALAKNLGRPFSTVFALLQAIAVQNLCRDTAHLRVWVDSLIISARDNGFPYYAAAGRMSLGRLMVEEGKIAEGIPELRAGLDELLATGAGLIHRFGQLLLAESCLAAGRRADGLEAADVALRGATDMDHRLAEAELHRLRGELMLLSPVDRTAAQSEFRTALEISRKQKAKSWELRATTSLARLLDKQGHRDEARAMLAEIYNWFSEGFDTADLKDAKTLLDDLGA